MRKTLSNVFRWKMTEVEENALVRLQSFVDRPCNNIPRSKFIDESFTCAVDQVGPFTANGFGYQERRKVWKLQSRRVKLDEFHIAQKRSCTISQRKTVSGCYRRIRRFTINLSCTT